MGLWGYLLLAVLPILAALELILDTAPWTAGTAGGGERLTTTSGSSGKRRSHEKFTPEGRPGC